MNKRLTRISKYMSFILKHNPQAIGMKLDADGFLVIEDFIKNANAAGKSITVEQLYQVVEQNDEQRFTLSEDKLRIRSSEPAAPKATSRRAAAREARRNRSAAEKPVAQKANVQKPAVEKPVTPAPAPQEPSVPTARKTTTEKPAPPKPEVKKTGAEIWAQAKRK